MPAIIIQAAYPYQSVKQVAENGKVWMIIHVNPGPVKLPYLARSIDPRIETVCLGCLPDVHPPEWFCAWRFKLNLKENV